MITELGLLHAGLRALSGQVLNQSGWEALVPTIESKQRGTEQLSPVDEKKKGNDPIDSPI